LGAALQNKIRLKEYQRNEEYQKDENYTKKVDKFKEDIEIFLSYHDKLLFLISQHYQAQKTQTSPSPKQKNPTVLP
jgi:hypothetical protein